MSARWKIFVWRTTQVLFDLDQYGLNGSSHTKVKLESVKKYQKLCNRLGLAKAKIFLIQVLQCGIHNDRVAYFKKKIE